MKPTTFIPNELRDLIIGLVALIVVFMLWSILWAPIAI